MESVRAYISELNQKMIDNDSAFAESWVKSMGKILDMACQVQDKANKEMDVIIPCRYMRLSFLHYTFECFAMHSENDYWIIIYIMKKILKV